VRDGLAVPLAPNDVTAGLRNWDRADGLVRPGKGIPIGDLYVCADQRYLYLGVYSMEYLDESIYEGDRIPESERSSCAVTVAGKSFIVRFAGKDRKPTCDGPGVEVFETPGLKDTLIVRVPRAGLPADTQLVMTLTSHGRVYSANWKTELALP
jgi:hypothetical protein